jgi:O-antigen/teichoic acid export membrane protein
VVAGVADWDLSITLGLWLRAGSIAVGSLILIVWLHPRLVDLRARLRQLLRETREYGFAIYIGRLLSTGTYNMDVLMLGALTNAEAVALYTLAAAVARISLLPVVGATAALFPRMAREARIDPRWVQLSAACGIAGVIVLAIAGEFLIELVFSSRYVDAAQYLVPLALAEACRGVTMVYNTYLSAQAQGKALRDAGIILTGSNLILNFALIPPFGAAGAAWASFAALVANLIAHLVYYRRSLAEREVAQA